METISKVTIDQLRVYLPHQALQVLHKHSEKPELDLADRVFKLQKVLGPYILTNGQNGYDHAYVFGSLEQGGTVRVQSNSNRPDMGILIDFTATGKRLYEQLATLKGIDINWQSLIGEVYRLSGHASRIDIAVDLLNGSISVDELANDLFDGSIKVLNARKQPIKNDSFKFISSYEHNETIYVGSRKSDAFLRVYDKKREQEHKKVFSNQTIDGLESWIRVEGEFKHRLAHRIGAGIGTSCNLNDYLINIILRQWTFVDAEATVSMKSPSIVQIVAICS